MNQMNFEINVFFFGNLKNWTEHRVVFSVKAVANSRTKGLDADRRHHRQSLVASNWPKLTQTSIPGESSDQRKTRRETLSSLWRTLAKDPQTWGSWKALASPRQSGGKTCKRDLKYQTIHKKLVETYKSVESPLRCIATAGGFRSNDARTAMTTQLQQQEWPFLPGE